MRQSLGEKHDEDQLSDWTSLIIKCFSFSFSQLCVVPQMPYTLKNASPENYQSWLLAIGENLTCTCHRQTVKQLLPKDKRMVVKYTHILHIDKMNQVLRDVMLVPFILLLVGQGRQIQLN